MKKRINISIDDKTLYIVDALAKERGIDRSTMITLCIREKDSLRQNTYSCEFDSLCESYYKANALEPEQGWIME